MSLEPPDITNRSDSDNILRILAYLRKLPDVPIDAVEALEALLTRAESVQRQQTQRDTGSAPARSQVVTYQAARKGYDRTVSLVEHTLKCRVCGRTETVYRYPGAIPTVCDREECQEKARKQDNAERQRRYRACKAARGE